MISVFVLGEKNLSLSVFLTMKQHSLLLWRELEKKLPSLIFQPENSPSRLQLALVLPSMTVKKRHLKKPLKEQTLSFIKQNNLGETAFLYNEPKKYLPLKLVEQKEKHFSIELSS